MPRLVRHFFAEGRDTYLLCEGLVPMYRDYIVRDFKMEVIAKSPCLLRFVPP